MWVDYLWNVACLAQLGSWIETRLFKAAVNLDTSQFDSVKISIFLAFVAFTSSLIKELTVRQHTKLAYQRIIDELLLPQTTITLPTLDVQYFILLTRIASLGAQIKDTAFRTVKAVLIVIFNERGTKGTISEIVRCWPFEDIHLIITGSCRSVVPIFSLEVTLEVTVV